MWVNQEGKLALLTEGLGQLGQCLLDLEPVSKGHLLADSSPQSPRGSESLRGPIVPPRSGHSGEVLPG